MNNKDEQTLGMNRLLSLCLDSSCLHIWFADSRFSLRAKMYWFNMTGMCSLFKKMVHWLSEIPILVSSHHRGSSLAVYSMQRFRKCRCGSILEAWHSNVQASEGQQNETVIYIKLQEVCIKVTTRSLLQQWDDSMFWVQWKTFVWQLEEWPFIVLKYLRLVYRQESSWILLMFGIYGWIVHWHG